MFRIIVTVNIDSCWLFLTCMCCGHPVLNFVKKKVNNLHALSLQEEHYKKKHFSLPHAVEETGGRTNGRLMYTLWRLGI